MTKKLLIAGLVLVAIWQLFNANETVVLGPGVMAPNAPIQTTIDSVVLQKTDEYTISGIANFELTAKVLGKEDYHLDRGADLSPTDLALGWGNMSDENVLGKIDISQSGRFYYWQVDEFPLPRKEIETHSANMHLIPATAFVNDTLNRVRDGDIVEISGQLVEVQSETDGWHWRSSQTRNDTGAGACELFWVESLRIITPQ